MLILLGLPQGLYANSRGTQEVVIPEVHETGQRVDDVIRRETFTLLAVLIAFSLIPITIMVFVALKARTSHHSASVKPRPPRRDPSHVHRRSESPGQSAAPLVPPSSDLYDVSQLSRYGATDVRKRTRTWTYDKKLYGQQGSVPSTLSETKTVKPRRQSRRWKYS